MGGRVGGGSLMVSLAVLAACDLGVSNPQIIEEVDLERPEAIPAVVNGARYSFGLATTINGAGGVYSVSAILSDELTHGGSWAPPRDISNGEPGNDTPENQSHWSFIGRAAWQGEDAIEKVSALVSDAGSNEWIALAGVYAGAARRVQGDMFCDAVIDGGPLQPHTAFYDVAETHFTNAMQVAAAANRTDLELAAIGGRAQARMGLGDWSGAVEDAGRVPTDFVYAQPHSDNTGSEENGVFTWSGISSGQYSVWRTPFADWGTDLSGNHPSEGDPRVPYISLAVTTGDEPAELIGGDGRRPFWLTAKYTSRNDAIPIVKGTEMRLIEAEARLRGGDIGGAVSAINEVRAHHGLDDVSAAGEDEAWQLLMKERGIELWLEGRRLADLRRWAADPATRANITTQAVRAVAAGQDPSMDPERPVYDADPFCLRVSTDEIFSNRNLDDDEPT